MPNTEANGIRIEYETFGDPSSSPLLLIMGLGAQLVYWDEDFCRMLAEKGFYVIRYDNRDVGLSQKFEDAGKVDLNAVYNASVTGKKIHPPYTLNDMADDAVGLLDVLDIRKAHICGASMGGMIAQTVAINHPSRIFSLISIMSSTGDPSLPPPTPEAMSALMMPPPQERNKYIAHMVEAYKTISGRGLPPDEQRLADRAAKSFDRCYYPQGTARQLVAIMANGSRKAALAKVTTPTLVVHGSEDPLTRPEAGKDTAETIPGATLLVIEGMGHNIPHQEYSTIVNAIAEHAGDAKKMLRNGYKIS